MNKLNFLAVGCLVFALAACGERNANGENEENVYPQPFPEEECMNYLGDFLDSEAGSVADGAHIVALKSNNGLNAEVDSMFSIGLPVNETNVLPRMGTYRDPLSGGTLVFSETDASQDTIHPVAAAAMRIVYHEWETNESVPQKVDKRVVHDRGNGILTFYRMVCHCDDHPDGYPEYCPIVAYVYPDRDSLMTSTGYAESRRIYRFEK